MSTHSTPTTTPHTPDSAPRRDFLLLTAQAMGALGAAGLIWPFVQSMNPSADVLALASVEQDLSPIAEGQEIKVMWRGKPVFIRHRSQKNIDEANKVDISTLRDPETDAARVKKGKEKWLIMVGVCTHLGCIPQGNGAGDFDGWFCSCHGSQYDSSGRIRKGPAPKNLVIPEYTFLSDTKVKIG
ncbi:MAG: ubiquinol-cytochrome c reductase iron-sulfur subunit [Pseudomonadota bacterium]